MKTIISFLFILALACCFAVNAQIVRAEVSVPSAQLKKKPTKNAPVVRLLKRGNRVVYRAETNSADGWFYVSTVGSPQSSGWIRAASIRPVPIEPIQ